MDKQIISHEFSEGNYTPAQLENLEHLGEWVDGWLGFERLRPAKAGETAEEKDKRERAAKIPRTRRELGRGGCGDPSDAATSIPLTDALQEMKRRRWGGVGVSMITARAGLVGIDLDNVMEGGKLSAFGSEAVEKFNDTYIETSPSGNGLRVFVLGNVPEGTPNGSTAIGGGMKAEIYPAGARRFLRTTGATLKGTAGVVGAGQAGIEWLAAEMKAASPDKGDNKGKGAGPDLQGMSLGAVFDALAELRPDKEPEEVIEQILADVSRQPRSKLASAWGGDKGPWKGDWSTADLFMCCEAVRRGAGSVEAVIEVWERSKLSHRDKFGDRKDYRTGTAAKAACEALQGLRAKAEKEAAKAGAKVGIQLPEGLEAALTLSGDTLTHTKGGRLAGEVGNVVVLFRNCSELKGLIGFNELRQAPCRLQSWQRLDRLAAAEPGPLDDDDITRAQMYFHRAFHMKIDRKELAQALDAAAQDNPFDPLRDRLLELRAGWDGVHRLGEWLTSWARVDDTGCREYVSAVGRCFMVGAVARALSPGCQMDTVLSVEGSGGAGKSTLFRILADAVGPDLFADGVADVSSTAGVVEGTGGRWIVELAELAGVRRASDVEALKAALTRVEDTHRRPYDILPRTSKRRFVFVATTNRTEYLSDPSGALLRRFWPVRTLATEQDPIDRAALAEIAPQLWGEAVALFQSGERWHLSEEDGPAYRQWQAGREERREDGPFHNELVMYLEAHLDDLLPGMKGHGLKAIASKVGDFKSAEGDQVSMQRLAASLQALGLQSIKRGGGVKFWSFTPEGGRKALEARARAVTAAAAAAAAAEAA